MKTAKHINIDKKKWVAGVSDGLTLPCAICGRIPFFDYSVDDRFWKEIVSEQDRLGVICLYCLDKLAHKKGRDVSKHLLSVQFTGIGKTIELIPHRVYHYKNS